MKISFGENVRQTLKWNGANIEYKNRLSVSDMANLISSYRQMYFYTDSSNGIISDNRFNLIGAEINLMAGVLKLVTNIEVVDEEDMLIIDYDELEESGLYNLITEKIENYHYFRKLLDDTIADTKYKIYERESLNTSIKNALNSITLFIDKMSNVEVTPENMEKIKQISQEIISDVEKSSIAAALEDKGRKTRKKANSK